MPVSSKRISGASRRPTCSAYKAEKVLAAKGAHRCGNDP